ncbi:MAG: hypothetical protein HQL45_11715 [Alphaproteobacteria bacterium]|nr:hypothetical protein [Alphaproteobacteria bacterium]
MPGRPLLLAVLCLLGCVGPALAQSQSCPTKGRQTPKVVLSIEPGQAVYRNDLMQADLGDLHTKQRRTSYNKQREPVTAGLTRAEGGYQTSVQTMIYPLKRGVYYCGWLSQIEVRVFFKSMVVNVAGEYRPGSCEYTAVLDHENHHVAIFRRNMDLYARKIQSTLNEAVARYGSASGNSEQAVTKQFMAEASRVIKPLMDEMHAQAERDHAKLDSPESYRYTQSLCKGWKPAKARRGTG